MLLEELKRQTRQQHAALEQLNGLPQSLTDYLGWLETFFGFVEPWERLLAARLPLGDPIRAGREKTGWLRHDLGFFGYLPEAVEALPRCAELPPATSRAAMLGAAYVLEGSTLGGQFISRHLEETFDFKDGEGYRYFLSYGPQVGPMWQAFRQELLAHSSPESDPAIVAAAQTTFDRLQAWFAARKVAA